jgi:Flp pilus assembly protein CpaB
MTGKGVIVKGKGSALILAVLLALGATAAVFVYMQGVRQKVATSSSTVQVVVAKQDVAANTQLDALIAAGQFDTRSIPRDALVRGVVTSLEQMQGHTTVFPILANSQISTAFFSGTGAALGGGRLGIPKGYVAATVSLNGQQMVGGYISRNDHVTVYATTSNGKTSVLIPDARVLVGNPGATPAAGSSTSSTTTESALITLALTTRDAERLVGAQSGQIFLALLPPGQQGTYEPPIQSGS